jgi:hypothetical protein
MNARSSPAKTAIVSFDVESDYPPYLGDSCMGVETSLPGIIDLLRAEGVPANVFMLARMCSAYPSLPKEIADKGFSLGCHAMQHSLLCLSDFETQLREISESTTILQNASGRRMTVFRAPNFSVNGDTLRCLERTGYSIDSSVLPGRTMKVKRRYAYDFRGAPKSPYHAALEDVTKRGDSRVLEIPATENPLNREAPIGGGYLNTQGVDKAVEAVLQAGASPVVLVLHPWEFVDLYTKFPSLPRWTKKGCRNNLPALADLLGRLRAEGYEFSTLDEVGRAFQATSGGGERAQ